MRVNNLSYCLFSLVVCLQWLSHQRLPCYTNRIVSWLCWPWRILWYIYLASKIYCTSHSPRFALAIHFSELVDHLLSAKLMSVCVPIGVNLTSENATPSSTNSVDRDRRLCSVLERRGDRFEQATADGRECRIEGVSGGIRWDWNIKDLVIREISSDIERRQKIYWRPYESLTRKLKAWIRTHKISPSAYSRNFLRECVHSLLGARNRRRNSHQKYQGRHWPWWGTELLPITECCRISKPKL